MLEFFFDKKYSNFAIVVMVLVTYLVLETDVYWWFLLYLPAVVIDEYFFGMLMEEYIDEDEQ
jgi:uncharacterized membrane protein YwzB